MSMEQAFAAGFLYGFPIIAVFMMAMTLWAFGPDKKPAP